MVGEIFSRYEIKYLIPFRMYQALIQELQKKMTVDRNGDEFGCYNITSLYFDSPDKRIYYETRNKARFRQKLRLRIYDSATLQDNAFFEMKKKYKKRVNKRRTSIRLQGAYDYLNGVLQPENTYISNHQIFKEIDAFRSLYHLQPENIVSYDRQAFSGIEDKDLRVTFDYNLRCRNNDLRIENGPGGYHFVEKDLVVMEVKVDHSVPLWLARLISDFGCPKDSVSKFCTSADVLEDISKNKEDEKKIN